MCYDGIQIWSTYHTSNSVSLFGVSNPISFGTYTVDTPIGICSGGGFVWIANNGSNTVSRLNIGVSVVTITVGNNPVKTCYDGTYIWVTNNGSNSITQIATSGTAISTISITGIINPYWMCTDGSNLYITSSYDGTIGQFNIQVNKLHKPSILEQMESTHISVSMGDIYGLLHLLVIMWCGSSQ